MKEITVLFSGDFAPCRRYGQLILERGADIFGDIKPEIQTADVAFLNLECILSRSNSGIDKHGPTLRADPKCARVIKDAGFDVVGLANNHIMDYGYDGLKDTIEICAKENIATCGAGGNLAEAQTPIILERKGIKVAIIAIAEHEFSIASKNSPGAAPLDPIDNLKQINSIRNDVDLVFVTIHGGNEYFPLPRPGLRKVCKFLIDHGADAIICHHPHIPGGYEKYAGKPIFYSLGNFIFDNESPPKGWDIGYAVKFKYNINDKTLKHEIIPFEQSVENNGLATLVGTKLEHFTNSMNEYEATLVDNDKYEAAWDFFCRDLEKRYFLENYFPWRLPGSYRLYKMRWFKKLFFSDRLLAGRLNIIKCESHYEVLIKNLENAINRKRLNKHEI